MSTEKLKSRNAMQRFGKPAHKAVARSVGYALTLADEPSWNKLTIILTLRLTDEERAAFAFASLQSLNAQHAVLVEEAAL
ncbi:hypothetical protein [Roseobacter litoralis]|uniref:hypothetical protein n=1 Tax=Roseobacter litoralis TaxID=42443 RepID=UPI00248F77F8|nr:hypothetical protein [Roseobacter litoralis]